MTLALCYKDVSALPGISHIGLGVTALNLATVLHNAGTNVECWPVYDGYVLDKTLAGSPHISHVVLLAPWIDTPFMRRLTARYPNVQFTVTCHSNVGFLQVDPWSMGTICEQMDLEKDRHNFRISGNCQTYCNWVRKAYHRPCLYLPNMYAMHMDPSPRPCWTGGTLRIGIFGATRQLKNMGTAVATALVIAQDLRAETEIWVSGNREEHGRSVLASCRAMLKNAPHAKIVESPWQSWPQFRETVGRMNLLLQPSFTESFNNVTADGISKGVPSVVSPAIEWVPQDWQGDPDDACDLARVGLKLLKSRTAAGRGIKALKRYNARALKVWQEYLAA